NERTFIIERNCIPIDRYVCFVQSLLGFFARKSRYISRFISEIDQHEVVVSSSTDNIVSAIDKCFCHGLCIDLDLFGINGELITKQFAERDGFRSNNMFKRPSLRAWKNGHVEQMTHHPGFPLGILYPKRIFKIFSHQNNSAP